MSSKKKEVNTERVHCNHCTSPTLHRLVKRIPGDEGSDQAEGVGEISWQTTFDVLQCCGCSEVVVRRLYEFSEWPGEPDVRYFPPKASRHPPRWHYSLPNTMRRIFEETYGALDAGSLSLPLMGARTLIDLLITEKIGDVGTFAEKLKALEQQGFISLRNRDVLETALDTGSAAAHRGFAPKVEIVHAVMDIVENLLHSVYVLPSFAQKLKNATPPRRPRRAAASGRIQ